MVPGFSHSHVRSASLPCPSHPLVSHLENEIRSARSWISNPDPCSAVRTSAGLARIDALISALDDLLQLPEAQHSLRRAYSTDLLLDGLLSLADAYGSLRSAAISLKQHQAETYSALRRRDSSRLAASIRSQKRTEKELAQLAAGLRHVTGGVTETEIAGIVGAAISTAAAASVEAFSGVVAASAAASAAVVTMLGSSARVSWFKKKESDEAKEMAALESLDELEQCVGDLESGSESVFRSLVNDRVSLLNIVTPSF